MKWHCPYCGTQYDDEVDERTERLRACCGETHLEPVTADDEEKTDE